MREVARVSLVALFVTALVTAQLIAVKLIAIPLPVRLPLLDGAIIAPAGVLAYALTFFATDCYGELFGRRSAQSVVAVGFVMNLVFLGLVWLAIVAPASDAGVDPGTFRSVMGLSTYIVAGSLVAYLVSQNWDVLVFHGIRSQTGPQYLWFRNIVSTGTSQLLDTAVFIGVAFWAGPLLYGAADPLPRGVLLQLFVGQYLLKLLIALLDTPLVYAMVAVVRSEDPVAPSAAFD